MLTIKNWISRGKATAANGRPGVRALGLDGQDSPDIIRLVQAGFPFSRLARFQKVTALPWDRMGRFVAIRQRTLTRRQSDGRLRPDESDRVWRAAVVFDVAVDLFEGDTAAATRWLLAPQVGLGGAIPLEIASTDVGAREIENLIGRLEHGVFA